MKRVFYWLRIAFAVLILALIGWQFANWQQAWNILQQTDMRFLVGCVAIYYIGVVLSCIKWQLLLHTQAQHVPIGQLIQWYFLGTLANSLLPSSIGGDLGRGVVAGRTLGSSAIAWSSIVVERMTGLAVMFALSAIVLLIAPQLLGWPPIFPILVFAVAIAAAGFSWFWLQRILTKRWLPNWIARPVERLLQALAIYRNAPNTLFTALGLSLLFHGLNACSLWLVARAVTPLAPLQAALAYPLIDMVGLVPLTPGGLGIREGATTLLLGQVGLTPDQALAAAVLSRILLLLVSLSGIPAMLVELRASK